MHLLWYYGLYHLPENSSRQLSTIREGKVSQWVQTLSGTFYLINLLAEHGMSVEVLNWISPELYVNTCTFQTFCIKIVGISKYIIKFC